MGRNVLIWLKIDNQCDKRHADADGSEDHTKDRALGEGVNIVSVFASVSVHPSNELLTRHLVSPSPAAPDNFENSRNCYAQRSATIASFRARIKPQQ